MSKRTTSITTEKGNKVTDILVEFNRSQTIYKEGDYNKLTNLPSINNIILQGNKNSFELNLLGSLHNYETYLNFPTIPEANIQNDIFVDTTENAIYRWDNVEMKYFCIGSNYQNIEIINGGEAYFGTTDINK